jgi:FKBP-type peptidyl-prolyl cis-trans isomerase SlyD
MTKVSDGKAVHIDYTLKDDNGTVLDTTEEREPLAYLHGADNIIPGLEDALKDKEEGDTVSVTIAPEDAYGQRNDELILNVDPSDFPDVSQLQLGTRVQLQTNSGVRLATVTGITDEAVTLDLNHPLAGKTLHFDVEVTDVKEASEEEVEHGHLHTEGHQHH